MKRTDGSFLEAVARSNVPHEVDLLPRISAQLGKKGGLQAYRARPAITILVVLLGLAVLRGAVYAVGRALGYILGLGIVDQSSSFRILANLVVRKREEISLTVAQALASSDKTVMIY